ncbi:FadR family transcriptional regulator [Pseudonocardia sp. C8]|uniref:FadR/GntR family transcriptional regulator n=1 Tax=Pseudonocardia sp. C8 TaxID=2762759 RepID=UPI001643136F|nr:FadR/GntR family transcriptional regulator [Pseudonocardia sp. C8]MBC3189792.1 FadR family transcriptional regulator [Pseudonocardia sp. C8]
MQEQHGQGHQPPEWRPVSRVRAYELVVDRIEEQILAGTLNVGDRLPGERDLASMLEVSRAAVREAMRTLEAQGVVRSAVGSGTDAGTIVSAVPTDALTRLLRFHVALANFSVEDVVAARIMLERSSSALAAEHATADDLEAIRAPLRAMDATEDREAFNDLDTDFHFAIAEAGRNRLVANMTIAIRGSLRHRILHEFQRLGDRWGDVSAQLRAEHHAIFDAIVDGDGEKAADLIEQHIRSAQQMLSEPGS